MTIEFINHKMGALIPLSDAEVIQAITFYEDLANKLFEAGVEYNHARYAAGATPSTFQIFVLKLWK